MSKFLKRLGKVVSLNNNAIVLGYGFGNLELIVSTFSTVFIVAKFPPDLRARNLIYKEENFLDIHLCKEISVIISDRKEIYRIDSCIPLLNGCRPSLIIEGADVIERDHSKTLYKCGYRAVEQQKDFHVWKFLK